MIIQKIIWWLWNQMFQYAFIKALSLRNKVDFKLDISWFNTYFRPYELEIFDIEKKYATKNDVPFYEKIFNCNKYSWKSFVLCNYTRLFLASLNKKHFFEKDFKNYFLNIEDWYIEWYFQSEKYFKDYEQEIRKDFNFIIKPSEKNIDTIKIIKNSNSVSLHIRRWDYLLNKNSYIWFLWLEYYKKSIKIIKGKIENPTFFVFSDDINWVKENLKISNKVYYIDWNKWNKSYEDMRLMSLCKHNIIANSSFSWWGAWLNSNKEKIVIAPKKWFNSNIRDYSDIIPEKWIKI